MFHDSEVVSFWLGALSLALAGLLLALGIHAIIIKDTFFSFVVFPLALVMFGAGLTKIIHGALLAFLPYRTQEETKEDTQEVKTIS